MWTITFQYLNLKTVNRLCLGGIPTCSDKILFSVTHIQEPCYNYKLMVQTGAKWSKKLISYQSWALLYQETCKYKS